MTGRSVEPAGGSVVLLSGGMDSATCLALAVRDARPVRALTVLYGQRHAREIRAARAVANHYRVQDHRVVRLPVGALLASALTDRSRTLPSARRRRDRIPSTYVPARNTILLSLALGYAESVGAGAIYLGINAVDYSGYPDCRPEFLRAFQRLAQLATRAGVEDGKVISVRAPLVRMGKADIVRLGTRLGVPWEKTWSCYAGGRTPCGRCDACRLRTEGFRQAGVSDGPAAHSRGPLSPRPRRKRSNTIL